MTNIKSTVVDALVRLGVEEQIAHQLADALGDGMETLPPMQVWDRLVSEYLTQDLPFPVHAYLFNQVYANQDEDELPWAWGPTSDTIAASNIGRCLQSKGMLTYQDLYNWSVEDKEGFWQEVTKTLDVKFADKPKAVMDVSTGVASPQWFSDGTLNIAESCFQNDPDDVAITFQSETGEHGRWTFADLEEMSNRVANGLTHMGLVRGDAVAIAATMTAESVAIYLGIVKAGCVVVSIADSFAPEEIQTRLRIADARVTFTQDVILRAGKSHPMYQKVVDAEAERIVVLSGTFDPAADPQVALRTRDLPWRDFLSTDATFDAVTCEPMDAINILFSSGTTGEPKAIPWNHTTPIKGAMDGYFHQDIRPGDVVAWPTNLGWMMGPWLIFASLMNRASVALFYGSPAGEDFGQFVQDENVTMLGLVPSLVKAWRNSGCMESLDWSSIRCFSSTGEASNADDYLYLMYLAGYKPVIEYCGGTEIGGGFVTGTVVQPCSPATFSTASLGVRLHVLDESGKPASQGEIFIEGPSVGLSTKLLNRDHHDVYFAGCPHGQDGEALRRHGDQIEQFANGYFRAQGRADDTMNLGGVKVSSAEIERCLNTLDPITETAAIAVSPPDGGPSRLVIYTVLTKECSRESLLQMTQTQIKERLNPLFKIHDLVIIGALPRTASNKVMRRVLRDLYTSA
jgi:acetyl-CoA synthetase